MRPSSFRFAALILLTCACSACQGSRGTSHESATAPTRAGEHDFDRDTVQNYNPVTRDYEQSPPFGAQSNQ